MLMALADMVRILTTTSGTGTYQLGAVPNGFLSPFVGMASGSRSTWKAESADGLTWEIFEGVLTSGSPPTLSRARVILNSSGTTTAVNWPNNETKRLSQVMTADWLGMSVSGNNWVMRFANGGILQGGYATTGAGGTVGVTYFNAFPTQSRTIVIGGNFGTSAPYILSWNNPTNYNFQLCAQNTSGVGVAGINACWMASGE